MVADRDRLADLAFDIRNALREDRRPGRGSVEIRKPVQRARREVDVDGLGELADDRPILTTDHAEAEHPTGLDQLVGERVALHRDGDPLRIERNLRRPVQGHQISALGSVGRAHDVEPARHLPENAATKAVVLVGVGAFGERRDGPFFDRHAASVCATARRSVDLLE